MLIPCPRCGRMMKRGGPKKLCWYCTGLERQKGKHKTTEEYRAAIGEPLPVKTPAQPKRQSLTPQEQRQKEFADVNAKARARHISYGKYVAMMEAENEAKKG